MDWLWAQARQKVCSQEVSKRSSGLFLSRKKSPNFVASLQPRSITFHCCLGHSTGMNSNEALRMMLICSSDALSRIESQQRDHHEMLLDKMENNKDCLESYLSRSSITHHEALSTELSHVEDNIKEDVSNFAQEARSGHNELIGRSDNQIHELKDLSHQLRQVHKETNSNLSQVVGLCFGNMLNNEHRFTMAECRFRQTEKQLLSVEQQQAETKSQLSVGFRSVLSEVNTICTIGRSLLSMLVPFSEKALEYLRKNVRANMEIYALLLKMQTSMPQRMYLSRQESVHFEDVLGRKKLLPYDYFRHWDVFDSMLRCEFKGLPGEQKVIGGAYVLMNSQLHGVTIRKESWQRMVFPGTQIKMSVILETFEVVGGFCPRPFCPGEVEMYAKNPEVRCPMCSLVFVHVITDKAQLPRVTTSEHEPREHLGRDDPLRIREFKEIQAFRMTHVFLNQRRTEMIQKLTRSLRPSSSSLSNSECCVHYWSTIISPSDLLRWHCQKCHRGPHSLIQHCQNCEARCCSECARS